MLLPHSYQDATCASHDGLPNAPPSALPNAPLNALPRLRHRGDDALATKHYRAVPLLPGRLMRWVAPPAQGIARDRGDSPRRSSAGREPPLWPLALLDGSAFVYNSARARRRVRVQSSGCGSAGRALAIAFVRAGAMKTRNGVGLFVSYTRISPRPPQRQGLSGPRSRVSRARNGINTPARAEKRSRPRGAGADGACSGHPTLLAGPQDTRGRLLLSRYAFTGP